MSNFLPDKLNKNLEENIKDYIKRLYQYYLKELKTEDFSYKGIFIYHKSEPDVDGMDGGFWHLITKDYFKNEPKRVGNNSKRSISLPCLAGNGMMVCNHICREFHKYDPYRTEEIYLKSGEKAEPRFICLNRCERISWIKAIIKKAESNPEIFKIWERQEGNQTKIHIWYEEEDFLIVIGKWKNENKYNMITSFITNYPDKRKSCEKEYQKYINENLKKG